jgi:hypothetical protein
MGLIEFFFGSSESKDGVSVGREDNQQGSDQYEVIDHACVLVAVNSLTGQDDWSPEVIEHIKQNAGVTDPGLIEKHSGVIPHASSEVTCYGDGSILIESERGTYELESDERLIIAYATGPGRCHSVCIQASEFEGYVTRHEVTHIYTQKES